MIRVEFFDVARARAGTGAVDVEAGTLGDALRAAVAACPGLEPEIIRDGRLARHWRASLNGREFLDDPDARLEPGDAVLVLSALAGG